MVGPATWTSCGLRCPPTAASSGSPARSCRRPAGCRGRAAGCTSDRSPPASTCRVDRHRVIGEQRITAPPAYRPLADQRLANRRAPSLRGWCSSARPNEVGHRHVRSTRRCGAPPGARGACVADLQRLGLKGRRRFSCDLRWRDHRAQVRAPRGVADAAG